MARLLLIAAMLASIFFAPRGAAAMGFPGRQDEMPGVHAPQRFPLVEVTHIVTTEDGRYVAAAYYQHAQNRPGTDWSAWVALWDRVTGRRVIFRDACGPVAITADGGLLAMPQFDRVPGGRGSMPNGILALWRVGERKPERILALPPQPAPAAEPQPFERNPLAVVFAADGGQVIQLTADGTIVAHNTRNKEEGRLLAKVDGKSLPPGRWLAAESASLAVNDAATELRLTTSRRAHAGGLFTRWKIDLAAGAAEKLEEKLLDKPEAPKILGPRPKLTATTGNGKLSITSDDRGLLQVAQVEDGKLLETLRLDEAPAEAQEAAGSRSGRR